MFLIEKKEKAVKFPKGQGIVTAQTRERQDINRNGDNNPQIQGFRSVCCSTTFHDAPDLPAASLLFDIKF